MIINGKEIYRDLNASINIMIEGLKLYMKSLIKCQNKTKANKIS